MVAMLSRECRTHTSSEPQIAAQSSGPTVRGSGLSGRPEGGGELLLRFMTIRFSHQHRRSGGKATLLATPKSEPHHEVRRVHHAVNLSLACHAAAGRPLSAIEKSRKRKVFRQLGPPPPIRARSCLIGHAHRRCRVGVAAFLLVAASRLGLSCARLKRL